MDSIEIIIDAARIFPPSFVLARAAFPSADREQQARIDKVDLLLPATVPFTTVSMLVGMRIVSVMQMMNMHGFWTIFFSLALSISIVAFFRWNLVGLWKNGELAYCILYFGVHLLAVQVPPL